MALTSVQKKQLLRLPVVDASVSTSDKYAFLGFVETAGTGATVDFFSVDWSIDPTWESSELPQLAQGSIDVSLGGAQTAFLGTFVPVPQAVFEDIDPVGGWGYARFRDKTQRKRTVRKVIRRTVRKLPSPDKEIAARLHAQIEREAQEAELRELFTLLISAERSIVEAEMESRGLLTQYQAALEKGTFSAQQRLARELEKSYTEDEEFMLLVLAV